MDIKKEFWRWEENCWADKSIEYGKCELITAGIDVGSVSSQGVIVADGKLAAFGSIRTGSNSPESARKAFAKVLETADLMEEHIEYTVGTGYGRVNVEFADKSITEITCHARGANYMYGPDVKTILDMGGQDCKAIKCDDKGRVLDFLMNDKCAAGTGRGLEIIADVLQVPIDEMGDLSLEAEQNLPPVNSTCVVYAKTEIMSLKRQGWERKEILAAYMKAVAERVVNLINRIGLREKFAITGGIAKNTGVVKRIEKLLSTKVMETDIDAQVAGALGAALFAYDICGRNK